MDTNIIPVFSDEPVLIEDIFSDIIDYVVVIKGVAALGVFWPEMQISTLDQLWPDKAYFVFVNEDCVIVY